jgi:hypothetical protein
MEIVQILAYSVFFAPLAIALGAIVFNYRRYRSARMALPLAERRKLEREENRIAQIFQP